MKLGNYWMTKAIKKLSEPKTLFVVGLVYTFIITVAFLSPAADIPKVSIPYLDKIMHALIHCVLAFIWLWFAFSGDKYHISLNSVIVVLVLCFSYGIAIEAAQHWFTASRQFDLFDVLANGIGGLLGFWSFKKVRSRIVR